MKEVSDFDGSNKSKSSHSGLTQSEAHLRLKKYGLNEIKVKSQFLLAKNIISQFSDFLVIILIIAGILSLILGDSRTATAMFAVVILNAAIGFWQTFRTERTLLALRNLLPQKAKVLRDGKQIETYAKFIVPRDVVIIQAGDSIPADGKILESYNLKVNEASLTGESNPQAKESHGDKKHIKKNLVFMGTVVLEGEAKILISETGFKTEFGKIAEATKVTVRDMSPLQKRMRKVGQTVATIAVIIMVGIVFYQLFRVKIINGAPIEPSFFREVFLFALALAAALVPEGLPATISVALSIGARRLAKKNAVVKKLSSVETLGSCDVICIDKTGTLTYGKMAVVNVFPVGDKLNTKFGDFVFPKDNFLLNNFSLCNNVEKSDKGLLGDPNETAIYQAVIDKKFNPEKIQEENKKIYEFSFSAKRKMMSVVVKKQGKSMLYSKGNPEIIIEKSLLTSKEKEAWMKRVDEMAISGLRVLAFGHKELDIFSDNYHHQSEAVENKITFDGIIGIEDDIRPEAITAIKYCHQTGVKIVMVTGDYKITAEAIAKKLKIADESSYRLISGDELLQMSDIKLRENLLYTSIFYQIDPREKFKIVETLQAMGHTVAVTGDGVNDALALKKADIGVAMGKNGTDVAREAADMILLDDNFASIVDAILEGRTIWNNLKKFLFYVFSSNAGEFMTAFLGTIFGLPLPILAVQVLAVDLGTDVFPSLALASDPAEKEILERKVGIHKENLLGSSVLLHLLYIGVIMGGGAVLNFWIINGRSAEGTELYYQATTASFAVLVVCQIVNIFTIRGSFKSIRESLFSNKYFIPSILSEVILLLLVVYCPPIQNYLSTRPLTLVNWFSIILIGVIFLIIEEIRKQFGQKQIAK